MPKPIWNHRAETDERLEAIRDGRDPGLKSHIARVIADKEICARQSRQLQRKGETA